MVSTAQAVLVLVWICIIMLILSEGLYNLQNRTNEWYRRQRVSPPSVIMEPNVAIEREEEEDQEEEEEENVMDTCSICLSLETPNKPFYKLACGHEFHRQCVSSWWSRQINQRESSCPCCRRPFVLL